MNPVVTNEAEFYFDHCGAIRNFFHGLAHRWGIKFTVVHRVLGFLLVTWVPLLFLAIVEGRALGSSPKESFLLDLGALLIVCSLLYCFIPQPAATKYYW